MIGDIRKSLKSPAVKLLLWAVIGSMFIGSISLIIQHSGRSEQESVAMVNGYPIGILEFRRKLVNFNARIQQFRQKYGDQAEWRLKASGFDRKPDVVVLEALVGNKVLKSVSDTLGLEVHHDYMHTKLRDFYFILEHLGDIVPPYVFAGGTLDVAALKYNLKQQGISEEEFEEILNDAMLRAFLIKLVEGGLYIPRNELKDAYIGQFLRKKFAYVLLPRSRYLEKVKAKKITDAEIEKFYSNSKNRETYRIPEKRSAKVWAFSPDGFGVIISDKALKDAYNSLRRQYIKKPAEVDVQHILFKFTDKNKLEVRAKSQEVLKEALDDPEKFAQLA